MPAQGTISLVRILQALLLIILVSPALSLAETVELSGVKFSVQEYKRVDSSTFKISVLGKPKIVKEENVDDEIVRQFFASWDKTKNLGIKEITSFCIHSIKDAHTSWAVMAFDALALTFADSQEKVLDSLEEILLNTKSNRESSAEFLRKQVSLSSFAQYRASLIAALLVHTAVVDLEWIKKKKSADIEKYSEQVKSFSQKAILSRARDQRIEEANNLLSALEAFYSSSDPIVKNVKSFVLYVSPFKKYHAGELSPEALKIELGKLRKHSEYSTEDDSLYLPLIHASAEKSLANEDGLKALRYLSLIGLDNRTPETHRLILESLGYLTNDSLAGLSEQTRYFLSEISKNDAHIRDKYFRILEKHFHNFISDREPQKAETHLEKILELRPDPDSANDALRTSLAILYLDQGLKNAAKDHIRDIKTGISFLTRLRLIFSGIYIPTAVLIFLLAVPLLGTVTYLMRTLAKQKKRIERLERETYDRMIDEAEQSKLKGFNPSPRAQINPLQKEYDELLAEFGLRGKVSLRQIKSAYRKLAKRAHPDMKPGEESDEFLKIKKNYEKILSLRRKLAID